MEVTRELLVDGRLPRYTSLGSYPIVYLDGHDCVLCWQCATASLVEDEPIDERDRPVVCDVHWEGPPDHCESCGAEIESAYGDPDSGDS